MTIDRKSQQREHDSLSRPTALDRPYGDTRADGFGGDGPTPDGFGAPPHAVTHADPDVQHAGQGAATGDAARLTAAATMRIAAPPVIDFGEVVAGENPTESRPIYNLHPTHLAGVHISVTGSPDIALLSAPDRLRPSREGSDAPVVLRYLPTKRSDSRATLKIHATWQQGVWPATDVEVPVIGKAYAAGEKPHGEEAAARARADDRARADAAAATHDAELDAAVVKDNAVHDGYPQGIENQLVDQFNAAKDMLDKVTLLQLAGIEAAAAEAAAFRRKIPHADPSLLFTLAMFGLDMATAGLAGAIARRVSTAMSQVTRTLPQPRLERGRVVAPGQYERPTMDREPEELVAFVADALKQGIKDAGKAARKAATGRDAGKGEDGEVATSDDPRINFFTEQTVALAAADGDRKASANLALTRLRPLLRSRPDAAVAGMAGIVDGFREMAADAHHVQSDQSRFAWMRFLAQSSLGALDAKQAGALGLEPGAEGEPITDIRGAIAPPREHEALERFDGVLDLEFEADVHEPSAPVKVVGASMTGVTGAMADRLRERHLAELGVVIRAHGRAPGLANLPISVVRDEAGNLRFTDETGAPGVSASWLARKGGGVHDSEERRRLGAAKLMEEVMVVPLAEIVLEGQDKKGVSITTDHDERRRR